MNKRFQKFCKRHQVEIRGDKAILYKAVYKKRGRYFSDFDNNFYYKVGKTIKEVCDQDISFSCSFGLHVSSFEGAAWFGRWHLGGGVILECEVPIDKIVVPLPNSPAGANKVRTSELTVLREVPVEEYKHLLT